MKKIIMYLLLGTLLTSCGPIYQTPTTSNITGMYNVVLDEVERPQNTQERYGESTIIAFEEDSKTKYCYEDELIRIVWLPTSTQFSFLLENKSDHSIKIIWDEAAYVDISGSSGRIMHAGVKYAERNNPQPPTIIVKKTNITDIVLPTENVYMSAYYSTWQTKKLLPYSAASQKELEEMNSKYIGKTVKILLPIQIQDTVNEYLFSFKIDKFIEI